jgi:hypothetical protein
MGMATPAKRPVTAEAKSTFFHISLLRYLGNAPTRRVDVSPPRSSRLCNCEPSHSALSTPGGLDLHFRSCTHKIEIGKQRLVNVRFAPKSRHSSGH